MKKPKICTAVKCAKMSGYFIFIYIIFLLALSGCGDEDNTPETDGIDMKAKALFENAAGEIIHLASEDPSDHVRRVFGDDVDISNEETEIDGKVYYKTAGEYRKMREYYAEIFTGEALDWILSTKFANVDGVLYCSPIGGATGWSIEDISVSLLENEGGHYTYLAYFYETRNGQASEEAINSTFELDNTENGLRITNIDYIPDLLAWKVDEKCLTDEYLISIVLAMEVALTGDNSFTFENAAELSSEELLLSFLMLSDYEELEGHRNAENNLFYFPEDVITCELDKWYRGYNFNMTEVHAYVPHEDCIVMLTASGFGGDRYMKISEKSISKNTVVFTADFYDADFEDKYVTKTYTVEFYDGGYYYLSAVVS